MMHNRAWSLKTKKSTLVYESILCTLYTGYMFRSLVWASSGRYTFMSHLKLINGQQTNPTYAYNNGLP